MTKPTSMFALLSSLWVAACGGSSDTKTPIDCPGFSRIVQGSFARTDTELTWTMEVESVPAQLTFNRTTLPDNAAEYVWQISVNADNIGEAEFVVGIEHFIMPGAPEVISSDILGMTQKDLWKLDALTGVGTSVARIDASLVGSVFTFHLASDAAPELAAVTAPTQSEWLTLYRYGAAEVCRDTWP